MTGCLADQCVSAQDIEQIGVFENLHFHVGVGRR
jgi:hypothetical protein